MIGLSISISDHLQDLSGERVLYTICFKGKKIIEDSIVITTKIMNRSIDLIQNTIFRTNFHDDGWLWSPENPNLFEVNLVLSDRRGSIVLLFGGYNGILSLGRMCISPSVYGTCGDSADQRMDGNCRERL